MDDGEDTPRPDLRQLTKSKIMGRLARFGKSKEKEVDEPRNNDQDVSNFLHGSSDKLYMTGVAPPAPVSQLPKVDVQHAQRWPAAGDVLSAHEIPASRPPRPSRKGLNVQFTNRWPEIIGYGGEDFEEPTILISQARDAAKARAQQNASSAALPIRPPRPGTADQDSFVPVPVRRTQTGHGGVPETTAPPLPQRPLVGGDALHDDEYDSLGLPKNHANPNSFAARVKAEMRAAEGRAFANAVRKSQLLGAESRPSFESVRSTNSERDLPNTKPSPPPKIPQVAARPASPVSPVSPVSPISPVNSYHQASARIVQPPSSNSENLAPAAYYQNPQSPGHLQQQFAHAMPSPNGSLSGSRPRAPQRARSNSGQSAKTFQSTTTANADDQAFEDFAYRVQNSYKIFGLSAESVKPLYQTSLGEMARLASWWFLRGRNSIEIAAREKHASTNGNNTQQKRLLKEQGHADLAKALWIVAELMPHSKEIGGLDLSDMLAAARDDNDAEFVDMLEQFQNLRKHLKKLTSSMKRNNFLPPTPDEAPLSSGIDNAVWVPAPPIPAEVCPLLCNNGYSDYGELSVLANVTLTMPLGDTPQVYNYSRTFVNVILMGDGFTPQQEPASCIMSVSRGCNDMTLVLYLTSQGGLIDLCVRSDPEQGLSWKEIQWRGDRSAIDLKLPRGYMARIQMQAQDFMMLWSLYDHISKTSSTLHSRRDEENLFDKVATAVQYFDDDPHSQETFPRVPLESCYVRLLEKTSTQVAGTGARTTHCGYRIAIMTGPRSKQLHGISRDLPASQPIRYEFMRGPTGDPTFALNFQEGQRKTRLALTFSNDNDRAKFHHILIGGLVHEEAMICSAPLTSFSTAIPSGSPLLTSSITSLFKNGTVQVLNHSFSDTVNPETTKTVLSGHLRIIVASPHGTITDRLNIRSGELLIRLPASPNDTSLTLHRMPQADVTLAIADSRMPPDGPAAISSLFSCFSEGPSLRTFKFADLADLHAFQAAITGHSVLFDGHTTSFAISRRRMVVPIYKKWEANTARIQIVRQEKTVMLCAWFEGWSKGESMNFALRSTDVFEKSNGGGFGKKEWSVKLVDAKFPLPKGGERDDDNNRVDHSTRDGYWAAGLSFDTPEYAGEHDDIVLVFEREIERDAFADALPAVAKSASRITSVSRR